MYIYNEKSSKALNNAPGSIGPHSNAHKHTQTHTLLFSVLVNTPWWHDQATELCGPIAFQLIISINLIISAALTVGTKKFNLT